MTPKPKTIKFYLVLFFVWFLLLVPVNLLNKYTFYSSGLEVLLTVSFWAYLATLLWIIGFGVFCAYAVGRKKPELGLLGPDTAFGLGIFWSGYSFINAVSDKIFVDQTVHLWMSVMIFLVASVAFVVGKNVNLWAQKNLTPDLVLFSPHHLPQKTNDKWFHWVGPILAILLLTTLLPVALHEVIDVKPNPFGK